jgi:CDP-diacylglycerol--glycerol-3-phosphate 3-phosphatidyltransferase
MIFKNFINVPNILTLIRLVVSPIMLPVLLVYLLPLNIFWVNCILAGLFALFSITDFFDGYLARRYAQVSSFGRFLDPIADKFLIFSTLVALLAINKIFFVWVLILIGREFFVLGLRQMALENNLSINVSWFGKIKTLFQVLYLVILIANPFHSVSRSGLTRLVTDLYNAPAWTVLETLLMVAAVSMTLVSAERYYHAFMAKYIEQKNK